MSTALGATKFSAMSTKFQVGTAALALATAATLTPVMAHAAPSLAPFAEGVGDSAALVIDPIINPGSSSSASATTDPCATANFKLGCYTVQGAVAGTQAIVRGAVIYVGTVAYVFVEGTGELLKLVGNILPGPVGDFFTNVGDGVSAFATNIGQTFHVGPYLTGA